MAESSSPRFRTLWLILGLSQLVAVLVIAVTPQIADSTALSQSDDVLHLATFFVLMVWFGGLVPPRSYLWLLLALTVYAVGIEFAQTFTPNRKAELSDFAADMGGLAVGWLAAVAGLRRWPLWLEALLGAKPGGPA